MSDGWCEVCMKKASLKDEHGRYTYVCDTCPPKERKSILDDVNFPKEEPKPKASSAFEHFFRRKAK